MTTQGEDMAFPSASEEDAPGEWGLTKREYIAALALQGLLSNPSESAQRIDTLAADAVDAADALLKKLT